MLISELVRVAKRLRGPCRDAVGPKEIAFRSQEPYSFTTERLP